MPVWLHEAGIGEARAALVDGATILEASVEREDDAAARPGAVLRARLVRQLIPHRRAVVRLASGAEALLEPIPPGASEGATITVLVTREALDEPGHPKRARVTPSDAAPAPAPTLRERLAATGHPVTDLAPHAPDALEAAGWSELIDEATSGEIAFPGGALRLSLTPAMTLFDVDGILPLPELAVAGAAAAACAIRRMGIGGSIGIDLPTLPGKAERQAAAAAFDAHLPQPYERTAVNGFGFLQVVRRRPRASLPELLRHDPPLAAALALLRRAERSSGAGQRSLVAAPAVIAMLEARPQWIDALARRLGAGIVLRVDPARPISAGDVSAAFP